MGIKKIVSTMLVLTMLLSTAAMPIKSEAKENIEIWSVDLNAIDLNKPYYSKEEFVDNNGNIIVVENEFIPNKDAMFRKDASVGTWVSKGDLALVTISYSFDLSKSGSEWKISNGRDLAVSGMLISVSNQKLSIGRAISTPSYVAEISGSATVKLFDNAWVPIGVSTPILKTTVMNGVVSVSMK